MSRNKNPPDDEPRRTEVRLDKWLWAARFYKTRSLASKAIDAGHVRVNGNRCKAGRTVHTGDHLALTLSAEQREVMVLALSDKRGPAAVAQTLYEETPLSIQRRADAAARRRIDHGSPAGGARPTKRQRRELEHWKNHSS